MSEGVLLALLSRFSRRQVSQWRQSTSCLWNQRPSQCFSSIAGSTCGEGHSEGHFGVGNLHSTNATRNVLRENNGAFSPLPKRLIHTTNVCHASRRNFYDVLGVSPNADTRELKAAYYRLAKKLHPDNSKDPEALEKFQELQKAYSTLKDTDKRRQYDQMGHDNYERMDSSGGGPEGSPFEDFGSVHDIFSAFMGGRRGGGFHSADDFFSGSGFGSGFVAQVQQNVQISFMEAVQGCSREVHLGSGRQKVKVEFEAGVNSGDMLSVRPNPNIEVILNVSIKPHKIFRREGLNIIRLVDVDVTDALLGTTVSVDTVHGKTIHVAVPECSQNGDRLVVHGEGVRSRKKVGDFLLVVKLIMPSSLTERQRHLLVEFQNEGRMRRAA
ncbi:hypothetical protein BSKO_05447 [Bryopsis sp. KO-2023]|nr:hypothetical protein BSKO_05447 [Bryopsis sp. KO-2023]